MKNVFCTPILFAALAFGLAAPVYADESGAMSEHQMHMVKDLPAGLEIGHPVIVIAGKAAKSAAAYMVIENTGAMDDRLIGASAGFARTAELHTHIIENDIAKMRKVEGGLDITAGGTRALEQGGDHVMIMGLTEVPEVGQTVTMTLSFENAGEVTVPFIVMDAATAGAMDHDKMDHGHGDHGGMTHAQ